MWSPVMPTPCRKNTKKSGVSCLRGALLGTWKPQLTETMVHRLDR